MASSAPTASSLSRFRPVVLTIAGASLAFSTYYLYTTYSAKPQGRLQRSNAVHRRRRPPALDGEHAREEHVDDQDGAGDDDGGVGQDGAETVAGDDVPGADTGMVIDPALAAFSTKPKNNGHRLEQLLYYIAEEHSRKDAYVHWGVSCNSCGQKPIRGVRYRCSNCADYDLCEDCEASALHPKTHIFYKVNIPAPFFGNPRQAQAVAYPGKPERMPRSISHELRKRLMAETQYENHEIDGLYDQFTCLADWQWDNDPNGIGAAISRPAFDRTFVPHTSISPPKPNLLYDRMFTFYDTNNDGLIGFEEFLKGVACVHSKGHTNDRLRKVFDGYDIDRDGLVSRKDFLRIFRAYYAIQKEITHDLLAVQEEELLVHHSMEAIMTSQPLSAAFTEPILAQSNRGPPESKLADEYGDRRSNLSAIRETSDDVGDRGEVVGNPWGQFAGDSTQVLRDRRRRREFYTDEEEGFSFDGPISPATRSPANSDDFDSESANASDSSTHVPEAEKDFGREILYQVTQQGLNELLDMIFKEKEDLAMEIEQTKEERAKWLVEIGEVALQVLLASKSDTESELPHLKSRNESSVPVPEAKLTSPMTTKAGFEAVAQRQEGLSVTDDPAVGPVAAAESQSVQTLNGGPVFGTIPKPDVPQPPAAESYRSEAAVPTSDATLTSTLDQTMPQNRSNSEVDLAKLRISKLGESRSLSQFSMDDNREVANAGLEGTRSIDQFIQFMFASEKDNSTVAQNPSADADSTSQERPSPKRLAELLQLQLAEGRMNHNGGPGKLNFNEFEKLMGGDEGKDLAFVEGWFELGSF